jgi:hypothetical protein
LSAFSTVDLSGSAVEILVSEIVCADFSSFSNFVLFESVLSAVVLTVPESSIFSFVISSFINLSALCI